MTKTINNKFKKVEIGFGAPLLMQDGEVFTGLVGKISTGRTVNGDADFVTLADSETNEKRSLLISAGLSLFDWQGLAGREVQIVSLGEMYNDRTKRKFRAYDLYVAEE